jgi:hypothetical protein
MPIKVIGQYVFVNQWKKADQPRVLGKPIARENTKTTPSKARAFA